MYPTRHWFKVDGQEEDAFHFWCWFQGRMNEVGDHWRWEGDPTIKTPGSSFIESDWLMDWIDGRTTCICRAKNLWKMNSLENSCETQVIRCWTMENWLHLTTISLSMTHPVIILLSNSPLLIAPWSVNLDCQSWIGLANLNISIVLLFTALASAASFGSL